MGTAALHPVQFPTPARSEPDKLWCRTLGELALYPTQGNAQPLMRAGRPLAILVYLALSSERQADRDHVAELFWPGVGLTDAQHSLRQTLYRLRQLTGGTRRFGFAAPN